MSGKPSRGSVRVEVTRQPAGRADTDFVAAEEPLEIRIDSEPVAVTMRTPGHDEELALYAMNWLVQGVIGSARG